MNTMELEIKGTKIQLRLTCKQLQQYETQHGQEGFDPLLNVLNAINSSAAMADLFTAALRGSGVINPIQDGAALIDALTDDGNNGDYLRELVVLLAAQAGLVEQAEVPTLIAAAQMNRKNTVKNITKLLLGDEAQNEPEAETADTANPT